MAMFNLGIDGRFVRVNKGKWDKNKNKLRLFCVVFVTV